MALTSSERLATVIGKRMHVYGVTFDATYPSGGEDLISSLVGLNAVSPAVNGANFAAYHYTTKNLQRFTADGSEATGDQSAVSVTCFV